MTVSTKTILLALVDSTVEDNDDYGITPSEMRIILKNTLDTVHGVYGGLYMAANVTPVSLDTTPVALEDWTGVLPLIGTTLSAANGTIECDHTGVYEVQVQMTFEGVANVAYLIELAKNGISVNGGTCSAECVATPMVMGFTTFVSVTADQVLTLYASSDEGTGQAFTLAHGSFTAKRISS